jgi:hypothetical protein
MNKIGWISFSLVLLALSVPSQPRNIRSFAKEKESAKGVIFSDPKYPPPPDTVYLDITPCSSDNDKEYIPFRKEFYTIELTETAKPCGKKLVQLTQGPLVP